MCTRCENVEATIAKIRADMQARSGRSAAPRLGAGARTFARYMMAGRPSTGAALVPFYRMRKHVQWGA